MTGEILKCALRPIDPAAEGVKPLQMTRVEGALVVGRSEDVGWRVPDPAVSRRHARLSRHGERITIQDLGSRHGTTVNGARLVEGEEVELRQGDVVGFGSWRCMVSGPRSGTMMQTITDTDVRVQRLEQHALNGLAQMKLDRLLSAARAFSGTSSREEVAEVLVGALKDIRGCQRAYVVRQVGSGEFDVVAQSHAPGEIRLSQTLIQEASGGKIAQLLSGAAPDTRSHSLIELDIQTALCAPVMALGAAGLLPLHRLARGARTGLSGTRRRTARLLWVWRGSRSSGSSLRRWRSGGGCSTGICGRRGTPRSCSSRRGPGRCSGWDTCSSRSRAGTWGGDLFDIFTAGDGRVAFFLGDATGKGVGAGMQMVATQTHLRTLLARGIGLSEAMGGDEPEPGASVGHGEVRDAGRGALGRGGWHARYLRRWARVCVPSPERWAARAG